MPMTSSRVAFDPYAGLSWTTTIAILALQKLRRARAINHREKSALASLADQLELLGRASEITLKGNDELVPAGLRQSFFTLVAIGGRSQSPCRSAFSFGETGRVLRSICDNAESNQLDPGLLVRTQTTCVDLLEQLNEQRPRNLVG